MEENLVSPINPEEGIRQDIPANPTTNPSNGKPENKFSWVELVGGLIVVCWLLSQLVDSNNTFSLLFCVVALMGAYAVTFHALFPVVKSVRILFVGWIIFTMISFGAVWLKTHPTPEPTPKPVLVKWQPPELFPDCKWVNIFYGDYASNRVPIDELEKSKIAPMTSGGGIDFPPVYISSNRLYVMACLQLGGYNVATRTNLITIKLSDGIESLKRPEWDVNTNSYAVEIVDIGERPIFQVVYKNKDTIVIQGEFISNGKLFAIYGHPSPFFEVFSPVTGDYQVGLRKPMFKYPSSLYPGVLAQ